jgi:DNA-binding transcriptional ArsR family regulator
MARNKPLGRKQNTKGRSTGEEPHFRLFNGFARTDIVRRLSGNALKIWIELHARHFGHNNGQISLSCGECAEDLGMSKTSALRAFKELQEKGLIKLRREGKRLGRLASEWELTDQPANGRPATREYQTWNPPPKPARPPRQKSRPTKAGAIARATAMKPALVST